MSKTPPAGDVSTVCRLFSRTAQDSAPPSHMLVAAGANGARQFLGGGGIQH
jgi:hypothetical protein